jgi:hypothetical protein
MPELPDYPVPQFQIMLPEDGIEQNIERHYLCVIHKIPDLPADTPVVGENPDTRIDDAFLLIVIVIQAGFFLILFPDIIGRRSDD